MVRKVTRYRVLDTESGVYFDYWDEAEAKKAAEVMQKCVDKMDGMCYPNGRRKG